MVSESEGDARCSGQKPGIVGRGPCPEVLYGEEVFGVERRRDRRRRGIGGGRLAGCRALQHSRAAMAQGGSLGVPQVGGAASQGRDGRVADLGQVRVWQRVAGEGEGSSDAGGAVAPGIASSGRWR